MRISNASSQWIEGRDLLAVDIAKENAGFVCLFLVKDNTTQTVGGAEPLPVVIIALATITRASANDFLCQPTYHLGSTYHCPS
jgi:hypothetical protein